MEQCPLWCATQANLPQSMLLLGVASVKWTCARQVRGQLGRNTAAEGLAADSLPAPEQALSSFPDTRPAAATCCGSQTATALLRGQHICRCPLPLPLQEGSAALVCHTQVGQEELNCLAINPSGSLLAGADDSGTVHLLSLPSWQARQALQGGHTSICSSVAFSPQRPTQGVPVRRQTVSCPAHSCHLKFYRQAHRSGIAC